MHGHMDTWTHGHMETQTIHTIQDTFTIFAPLGPTAYSLQPPAYSLPTARTAFLSNSTDPVRLLLTSSTIHIHPFRCHYYPPYPRLLS